MKDYFLKIGNLAMVIVAMSEVGCSLDDRVQSPPDVPPVNQSPPEASPQNQAPPSKPVIPFIPTAIPIKVDPTLTFQWIINQASDSKRTLNRSILLSNIGYRSFHVDPPVTLSWHPQDSIEITIKDLPVKLKTPNTKLKPTIKVTPASPTSSLSSPGSSAMPSAGSPSATPQILSITPSDLAYQETKEGITDIHFTVSGLLKLFDPGFDEEEKMNITLELSSGDSNGDKITIDFVFVLMTPPSRVVFNQKTLDDFEATVKPISEELKYLESDLKQLSLIQVVEIQDPSDQPISVDLPLNLAGKLWQKSTWTDPQYDAFSKAMCLDLPQTIESTEVYSTSFILLPLDQDLPLSWSRMLLNETNPIDIPARETKIFGIYATPTQTYAQDFKTLMKRRDPKETARTNPIQTVQINTQCDFGCGSLNLSDTFKSQCDRMPAELSNFKAACNARVATCSSCISGEGGSIAKQNHCNECFEKETLETPSGITRYKGEMNQKIESQKSAKPNQVEARNQHPDRLKISPEALSKLGKWNDEITVRLRGVKLTRSDLVNFLILNHETALSNGEMKELENQYFDEVKFAQWALEELKAAKSRGETITLADVITNHRSSVSLDQRSPRRKGTSKARIKVTVPRLNSVDPNQSQPINAQHSNTDV